MVVLPLLLLKGVEVVAVAAKQEEVVQLHVMETMGAAAVAAVALGYPQGVEVAEVEGRLQDVDKEEMEVTEAVEVQTQEEEEAVQVSMEAAAVVVDPPLQQARQVMLVEVVETTGGALWETLLVEGQQEAVVLQQGRQELL